MPEAYMEVFAKLIRSKYRDTLLFECMKYNCLNAYLLERYKPYFYKGIHI